MPDKIAIIGAGAAGCFAAANIPFSTGREVVLFEKTGKVMQKVKVSGGGRCNVTHACHEIPELVKRYPRGAALLKKSLYEFKPQDTINWFGRQGVRIKEESDGRMFPMTDDSQTIIDAIWGQVLANRVNVQYHKSVRSIEKNAAGFLISFDDGSTYISDKVMLACGSIQKPASFDWLVQLGHTIQPPAPSLFTFNLPKHPVTELMGVSVANARVKIAGTKINESGPLLITHWGMSGPAVLRTSAWAAKILQEKNYEFTLLINWLDEATDADLKEQIVYLRQQNGKQLLHSRNPFELPKRLWEYLLQKCGIVDGQRWGEMPAVAQNKLFNALLRDEYQVKGKTTFKEEFVTCGGVTLSEINPKTMESRIVPGLYFGGEAMDVDGITGGYNFQHAWSSGWIAAHAMVEKPATDS